jgi:sulfite reductase (NADPH) flavoprotein alpha-component
MSSVHKPESDSNVAAPTADAPAFAAEAATPAAFQEGFVRGVAAAALLADAPFDDQQKAWLSGFVTALFTHNQPVPAASPPPPAAEAPTPAEASPLPLHNVLVEAVPPRAVPDASVPISKYSRANPYAARVLEITPLGPDASTLGWHLTLDIEGSGVLSAAGDLLGVFPANDPDLVRRILRLIGARGQEEVTTERGTGPAWRALLEELDLQTVTPEFVWLLSSCARNHDEAMRLEAFAKELTPPDTNVLTLMRRFPSARPALAEFAAALAPLVPQTFPLANAGSRHAEVLEALLSLDQGEPRGLLADARDGKVKPGDWLPIYVEPRPIAHPPPQGDTPVILIAHGRAAASARAFLAERSVARDRGRNWLFLAPEHGASEVYYARQFTAWQSARLLTRLDVAPREALVQRFRAQFDMLQRWLVDRSYLYVFGSAEECGAFQSALVELLVERARIPADEARSRLHLMQTTGQLRFVSA